MRVEKKSVDIETDSEGEISGGILRNRFRFHRNYQGYLGTSLLMAVQQKMP